MHGDQQRRCSGTCVLVLAKRYSTAWSSFQFAWCVLLGGMSLCLRLRTRYTWGAAQPARPVEQLFAAMVNVSSAGHPMREASNARLKLVQSWKDDLRAQV
eukprot:629553-Amphidinium_carterae.1